MRSGKKLRGLFLNSPAAKCSIYESGRMAFAALENSSEFSLDYHDLNERNRSIPRNYDFYLFNFHPWTISWLDLNSLRELPGLKITFVLETLPNNPFPLVSRDAFDIFCPIDPTIPYERGKIYPLPRPVETGTPADAAEAKIPAKPIIGTFGFGTPGKGFELVVDAVNREFDSAVIRINIPPGTSADEGTKALQGRIYAEYLADLCRKVAKPGIEIEFTREYFDKDQLIAWCGQNTLNCFLYNRNQPGLAATTDQAIACGRPFAVSVNPTFRHITHTMPAYPYRSLRDSIRLGGRDTAHFQREWSQASFLRKFEAMLEENRDRMVAGAEGEKFVFRKLPKRRLKNLAKRVLKRAKKEVMDSLERTRRTRAIKAKIIEFRKRQKGVSATVDIREAARIGDERGGVLVVSHAQKQCGIHQYGLNVTQALRNSKKYKVLHRAVGDEAELAKTLDELDPRVVVFNYYPFTMPWLTPGFVRAMKVPTLGVIHEVTQDAADSADQSFFDYHLAPDPTLKTTNPKVFVTPRLIPEFCNYIPVPKVPRFGSFGFGFINKGFERVVQRVQEEYDEAQIVLRMPFNDIVDPTGEGHALATAERCRALVKKPGIKLEIHHDFLTREELLSSLGENTANIFFYDVELHKGISSVIEHALAAQRPLVVNRCGMFRHVHDLSPSICIEDHSIREIVANGIAPLVPKYSDWSTPRFVMAYERIFDTVLGRSSEIRADGTRSAPEAKA